MKLENIDLKYVKEELKKIVLKSIKDDNEFIERLRQRSDAENWGKVVDIATEIAHHLVDKLEKNENYNNAIFLYTALRITALTVLKTSKALD